MKRQLLEAELRKIGLEGMIQPGTEYVIDYGTVVVANMLSIYRRRGRRMETESDLGR
ncbi:hypothetical protein AB5J62_13470 [Amycolatopsis sp. cg5]|uniref:hypothetical protein n=1 Tax=Amycolatopsis sp. cg5 TaxID=3238802 RepID=UPI0035252236